MISKVEFIKQQDPTAYKRLRRLLKKYNDNIGTTTRRKLKGTKKLLFDAFLTKEMLAEELNCSLRTVDYMRAEGLPCIQRKPRSTVLFDKQAVMEWLRSPQGARNARQSPRKDVRSSRDY